MAKRISPFLFMLIFLNCTTAFGQEPKAGVIGSTIKKIIDPASPLDQTLEKVKTMEKEYFQAQMNINADTFKIVQDLKNPFIPQIPQEKKTDVPVPATKIPKPTEQTTAPALSQEAVPQIPKPQFTISGLVWDTDRPQTIINNQVYTVGDTVDNWTIIEINPQGIKIQFRDQTFFIDK